MSMKKPLIAAAAVTTISLAGLGGVGAASAMSGNSDDMEYMKSSSMVDRMSERFNLDKNEVRAMFEQELKAEQDDSRAELATKLDAAVESGDVTREQADHILDVNAKIDAMLRTGSSDGELSSDTRADLKSEVKGLNNWGEEEDIDDELLGDGRLDLNLGLGLSLGLLNNNDRKDDDSLLGGIL